MSYSNPTLDQLFPLPQALDGFYQGRHAIQEEMRGKAFPASIVSVDATGTIVKVKFEVLEPGTNENMMDLHPKFMLQWPETEMPVATDLYGIAPLKKGDKGYCVPADVDLGAVSGYYDTMASLTVMPNLSTLAFHPIGNVKAKTGREDPSKYFLTGPTGVSMVDAAKTAAFNVGKSDGGNAGSTAKIIVNVGPVDSGAGNALQIILLVNASSDVMAKSMGIPLGGLYHNNGAVRYQWTVP
jgi:hypothetical protein